MLAGKLYNPLDAQLSEERLRARLLIKALNDSGVDDTAKRSRLFHELIPNAGEGLWLSGKTTGFKDVRVFTAYLLYIIVNNSSSSFFSVAFMPCSIPI